MSEVGMRVGADAFRWVPGEGPDTDILYDLASRFDGSNTQGNGPIRDPEPFLQPPKDEWSHMRWSAWWEVFDSLEIWRAKLLAATPRLLHRLSAQPLCWHVVEGLIHDNMVLYLPSREEPCDGYRRKLLQTLGRVAMSPTYWSSADKVLHDAPYSLLRTSTDLVLMWLPREQVDSWCESIFAIDDTEWQESLVYLLGTQMEPLLSRLEAEVDPGRDWNDYADAPDPEFAICREVAEHGWSHFMPRENLTAFRASVGRHLSHDTYLDCMDRLMAKRPVDQHHDLPWTLADVYSLT